MRVDTRRMKSATRAIEAAGGKGWLADRLVQIVGQGKKAFDTVHTELGRMLAEAIMLMDREEVSGPDYQPCDPEIQKWAGQQGSVYIGDRKVRVNHPRLRGPEGEIPLRSYLAMKKRDTFSEELLGNVLRGISARKYQETITGTAKALGVSATAVSDHLIQITAAKLREFKERDLKDLGAFAVFLDTIHRGGQAFVVALGIDILGEKRALGFWEGATENHEVCKELLADIERRGMVLSKKVIWVTDGGKGIIKALKDRYGEKLLHVRCMIHKSRNVQQHLPKRYRKEAHRRLSRALEQNKYADAKKMLEDFERWLREINESAADSLMECFEELLTLHRLQVPASLRKTLYTTNPIESMFSTVRGCERNIKRTRGSTMLQRWLAAVLLHCEKKFRRVKGHRYINQVMANIDALTSN